MIVPAALLSNAVYINIRYVQDIPMGSYRIHTFDYSHMFLGLVITYVLMKLFKHIKINVFLNYSDKYSYHIYLVHQLFILSPLTLLTLSDNKFLNITLALLVIFVFGTGFRTFVGLFENRFRHLIMKSLCNQGV